jgi:hypothetical protein
MKKTLVLFVFLLSGMMISKGQTNTKETKTTTNVEGTYQIQMIHTRNKPYLPTYLNEIVARKRDKTVAVDTLLSPVIRLHILPLSEISKPDFKPLQRITYVNK